ncbi:MAG: NAD-dependent epimerase/dehydratase family protein [Nevskiales bacterium]
MKIFLTGATGFVGAHTARALLDAGHELRLLVRNPDAARAYFKRHGHEVNDMVVADMADTEAVRRAMAGCDAVLHAAAAVSLDPRKTEHTYQTNVGGMKSVIGSACELGIPNILYVSSISVLMQTGFDVIDETTPLANTREAYSRSKRDSDEYVRELQRQGYPIQITYPSAIVGPDDPRLSEANHAFAQFVSQIIPDTSTGFQCVDVRDLAQAHRYLLEHPVSSDVESARYVIGGHYYPWKALRERLSTVTGRRLFSVPTPGFVFRALGLMVDMVKKLIPFETPISVEAMGFVTQWVPASSQKYLNHSGLQFHSPEETLADTVRWLGEAGHIKAKYAGRLVAQSQE